MKTFQNHSFETVLRADGSKEDYAGLARLCLNTPTANSGFTVETMRLRMKILDKLEGEEVELEDAEVEELKKAVREMDGKWARLDTEVLGFVDYVANL